MTTHVVLFTRDLRVHDHPALTAALECADRVVPLFVFDDAILDSSFAAPNRVAFLLSCLADLRASLHDLGGDLVLRRGDVVTEVAAMVDQVAADTVHVTGDVSRHARRRERALARALAPLDVEVVVHPGHLVHEPGVVTPAGGDHYRVFTPFWRSWKDTPRRALLPAPDRVTVPSIDPGGLPDGDDLVEGRPSPALPTGGETAARARLEWWLDGPIADYDAARNVLADDGTSRLSPHLHLGTISALEVLDRLDLRRPGHEGFASELCWREFNHQLLAATPSLPIRDYRSRGDQWREDDEAFQAWCDGRTGYPVVDAGMRQLRHEGWMHNRARMITASFLTKHLYLDWRLGAAHFAHWLVDGDLANNWGQWQWASGTGTDSRPNRMFNPVTQSQRYDPAGAYLRRWVPELAGMGDRDIHAPWQATASLGADYPPPIVDHGEARARFLAARGAT